MLKGSFAVLSLPGLLQLLTTESRSGRLDVGPTSPVGAARGAIWLESGRVVHAHYESVLPGPKVIRLSGVEAVYELVAAEDGQFGFEPGARAPQATVDATTDQLLMEAACRRDHSRRPSLKVLGAAVPVFAPVPEGRTTPRFDTLQWRLLATIDGKKDVLALSEELGVPMQHMSMVIADLVAAGVLQLA